MWQVIIHCAFILSALALAWIDRLGRNLVHDVGHETRERTAADPV